MNGLVIDIDTLMAELEQLAQFSDGDGPGITRVMLGAADLAARAWLAELYAGLGLTVRVDAAGNVFARWLGSEPALPAVATGSHIDAIPHSGQYDGTVGVLGGLEAIRALQRAGVRPRRSIELLMFTAEEPTRYGIGCLGSRLLSGQLAPDEAAKLVDAQGVPFAVWHRRAGGSATLAEVRLSAGCYRAFVELHIEQGPVLEREGVEIGVVTAIAAPAALRVVYQGAGGHAGAVLMPDRRDALLPAARLALAVNDAARSLGSVDTVATTGVLDVFPSAINSIPSRTYLEIDVRDIDLLRRDAVLEQIRRQAEQLGREYAQTTTVELIHADPPARCDPQLVAAIEAAAAEAGSSCRTLISRAYHDSLFMAQLCPTAMVFIPCRDGVSHRPDEYTSPKAISAGVAVLAHVLAGLAAE